MINAGEVTRGYSLNTGIVRSLSRHADVESVRS